MTPDYSNPFDLEIELGLFEPSDIYSSVSDSSWDGQILDMMLGVNPAGTVSGLTTPFVESTAGTSPERIEGPGLLELLNLDQRNVLRDSMKATVVMADNGDGISLPDEFRVGSLQIGNAMHTVAAPCVLYLDELG